LPVRNVTETMLLMMILAEDMPMVVTTTATVKDSNRW